MEMFTQVADRDRVQDSLFPIVPVQWRIQNFPEAAPTPKVGVLTYHFAKKLHENERIRTPRERALGAPLGPPMDYLSL